MNNIARELEEKVMLRKKIILMVALGGLIVLSFFAGVVFGQSTSHAPGKENTLPIAVPTPLIGIPEARHE